MPLCWAWTTCALVAYRLGVSAVSRDGGIGAERAQPCFDVDNVSFYFHP